jgi:hypothetical protein
LLGTAERQLSERLKLTSDLGVERIQIKADGPFSGSRSSAQILLSGSASLCQTGERLSLCGDASIRSDATGFGTLQRTIAGGLSATYRLDRSTTFGLGANYSRATSLGDSPFGRFGFFSGRASVDRKLTKSLTLAAFSNYRRRSGIVNVGAATVGAELRWNMGQ